jgi:hypothetical protein
MKSYEGTCSLTFRVGLELDQKKCYSEGLMTLFLAILSFLKFANHFVTTQFPICSTTD